jgi:chromosome segregation ATPase
MVNYVEKATYWEELAIKTQTTLSICLKDLDKLKAQLGKVEAELASDKKTTKIHEDLKAELSSRKIEIKAIRAKITKEKVKIEQLLESQRIIENHNQTLHIVNDFLSRNNLIYAERIRELQEQIDRAFIETH